MYFGRFLAEKARKSQRIFRQQQRRRHRHRTRRARPCLMHFDAAERGATQRFVAICPSPCGRQHTRLEPVQAPLEPIATEVRRNRTRRDYPVGEAAG